MKFSSLNKFKPAEGSVLPTTMVITFVIGATLASFLLLTQHQTFANARSQSWNHSLAVTEAGIEDAMQMINLFSDDTTKLLEWADPPNYSNSGWTNLPGTDTYVVVRVLGDDKRAAYRAVIDNTLKNMPAITVESFLRYDFAYKSVPVSPAVIGSTLTGYQSTNLKRRVLVNTIKDAQWALAMLAAEQIDLKGNRITTDSFDSGKTNYSDWTWSPTAKFGKYNPSKRLDHGDVATNGRLIDTLNAGNADIMGIVSTGPGGTVAIGPNASIGDEAWVTSGTKGIKDGYSRNDMNVQLTTPSLPTGSGITWFSGIPTESGSGTNINGETYMHVFDNSLAKTYYQASTLKGSVYVGPGVDAVIHLTHNVSLTGNEGIYIDPEAIGLTIYMEGSSFKLGGQGVANKTDRASAFQYFGLETNKELVFGGNADFIGAIFAPTVDFSLGGGGSTAFDFIGASVTKTVTMNGSFNFHYDEDLANLGPSKGFVPTSWAEMKP